MINISNDIKEFFEKYANLPNNWEASEYIQLKVHSTEDKVTSCTLIISSDIPGWGHHIYINFVCSNLRQTEDTISFTQPLAILKIDYVLSEHTMVSL